MYKKEPILINYLYFGSFLFLLLILSIYNVYLIESSPSSRLFFLFYSITETLLEVSLLLFVGWWLQKKNYKKLFSFFIGMSFLFFLTHIVDFILERILGLSFWETIGFVTDETFENLIEMLHASGVPLIMWISFAFVVVALPLLGIFLFRSSEKISTKRPIKIQTNHFASSLCCTFTLLLIWDLSLSHSITPQAYTEYRKSLPWKITLLQPSSISFPIPSSPKKPIEEKKLLQLAAEKKEPPLKKKPNIYLFVIESFREDFITQETAPHLYQFKQENTSFSLPLSNGNATHISWFSLFHSEFPFYWAHRKKENWKSGSLPLKLLKEQGYNIHVYSSAQMSYYGLEKLIFGEKNYLADSFNFFPHYWPVQAWETDARTVEKFTQDLENLHTSHEGNIFLFFWDSTHFDYSWPEQEPLHFSPISNELTYFKAHYSAEDIHRIKNRYRNAVHYVDSLFGKWREALEKMSGFDDAVVIVTGDHGEEFFEEGHLFHCSCLNLYQTKVPIYYKFGNHKIEAPQEITSQMEIFPTLFSYLYGKNVTKNLLSGRSIFDDTSSPFVITARYNASRSPYEFSIHNGSKKLITRFKNKKDILSSTELEVLSITDHLDNAIFFSKEEAPSLIDEEFGFVLEKLMQ